MLLVPGGGSRYRGGIRQGVRQTEAIYTRAKDLVIEKRREKPSDQVLTLKGTHAQVVYAFIFFEYLSQSLL